MWHRRLSHPNSNVLHTLFNSGLLGNKACSSIRDTLESRVISLPHISSDLQVADVFTKALTRQRHQFLVGKLLLTDLPASI